MEKKVNLKIGPLVFAVLMIIGVVAILILGSPGRNKPQQEATEPSSQQVMVDGVYVNNARQGTELDPGVVYRISIDEIIDGDAINIRTDPNEPFVRRAKLIGIDAPELEGVDAELGQKSAEHLEELIGDKDFLYITLDKNRFDDSERYYVYLWFTPTDVMQNEYETGLVNYLMVANGYAEEFEREPNVIFSDELVEAEQQAYENNVGLWEYGDFSKTGKYE